MRTAYLGIFVLYLFSAPAASSDNGFYISIIIDDLGYKLENSRYLIELPAALTYSILPNSPYGKRLAELAHEHNKEVMLHLPMQAETDIINEPGILTTYMDEKEFKETLYNNLQSIPFIAGINNHKGSLLTQNFKHMVWLMQELSETNLYFVDSRTTHQTVAALNARYYDVPSLDRDVFLDNSLLSRDIDAQFKQLKSIALKKGYAIAIGHPYSATIAALERFLPQLDDNHITLLPISALIQKVHPQSNRAHPRLVSAQTNVDFLWDLHYSTRPPGDSHR